MEARMQEQWAIALEVANAAPRTGCVVVDAAVLLAVYGDMEHLRADLVSCRGTVKTELNHYERLAMVHGQTPHGATYEAEAQRLSALLERIDALGSDGTKC